MARHQGPCSNAQGREPWTLDLGQRKSQGRGAVRQPPGAARAHAPMCAKPPTSPHPPTLRHHPPPNPHSFYLLFQQHTTPALARGHGLFGGRGYSQLLLLGPRVALALPDQRAERTTKQARAAPRCASRLRARSYAVVRGPGAAPASSRPSAHSRAPCAAHLTLASLAPHPKPPIPRSSASTLISTSSCASSSCPPAPGTWWAAGRPPDRAAPPAARAAFEDAAPRRRGGAGFKICQGPAGRTCEEGSAAGHPAHGCVVRRTATY